MKKMMKRKAYMALALMVSLVMVTDGVFADTWDLDKGDVKVVADGDNQKVYGYSVDDEKDYSTDGKDDKAPVITQRGEEATNNTVTLESDGDAVAKATLKDVDIQGDDAAASKYGSPISNAESAVTVDGKAEITIDGNVTLNGGNGPGYTFNDYGHGGAGIEVNEGSEVTIKGNEDSTLTATGGDYAAGIGSAYEEGKVEEEGEVLPVSVVGGGIPDAGKITIESGNVTAQGGVNAAGIGGGQGANGGDITVTGAATVVNATGGNSGAGIGGGRQMDGKGGNGGTITINNGTINAQGGECGAGIGSGSNDANFGYGVYENVSGGAITINGGDVTAIGGYQGAGIGGGNRGDGGNVTINGGKVHATTFVNEWGYSQGAGIGGGTYADGGDTTINGGDVTAIGGMNCAGIGGGEGDGHGNGGSFTMTAGKLTAIGGNYGAAIGGADGRYGGGNGGVIAITGGDILAIAGYGGSALGGGYPGKTGYTTGGTISISTGAALKAYAYGNKWAIDLDGSDTSGVVDVVNGRFRTAAVDGAYLGLDPVTKIQVTKMEIVDADGNVVAVLELPTVTISERTFIYRAFASNVPGDDEYMLKNSDGLYDNRYTGQREFADGETVPEESRDKLYVVVDGQMLNADDIIFIDWAPEPEPEERPDRDRPDRDDPDPYVPIIEPEVPLSETPVVETPATEEVIIDDPEVPLGDVPQTGDPLPLHMMIGMALLSLIGLVVALRKKPATR